jgi:hypothetical protein
MASSHTMAGNIDTNAVETAIQSYDSLDAVCQLSDTSSYC